VLVNASLNFLDYLSTTHYIHLAVFKKMLYRVEPGKAYPNGIRNEKYDRSCEVFTEEYTSEESTCMDGRSSRINASEVVNDCVFNPSIEAVNANIDYGAIEANNTLLEGLQSEITVGNGLRFGGISFFCVELCLFANVFLTGFDSTVTASTYTTIGSEFNAASTASWITTSYLLTSTAFQPLYGSFSDVLGRRICLISATSLFILGCLGCGLANHIFTLNAMRAISGIGGGGLVTLATIINSDIIPKHKRGNWQAFQNLLLGFGGICGACTGGVITEAYGWRWCFLMQIPIGVISTITGYLYVVDPEGLHDDCVTFKKIDLTGSITLVFSLLLQLLYLTIGGNDVGWFDRKALLLAFLSLFLLLIFIMAEISTTAVPILPPELLQSPFSFIILSIGILVGFASYAYLFLLPVLFQIVLGDSISKAGLRLAFPSFFTPIGGLITGYFMNKNSNTLFPLVFFGCFFMFIGNCFSLLIQKEENQWLLAFYLIPANVGQGMIFPSSLFCFIYYFDKDKQAIATSTAYLYRSIGSVWGVACSSSIVRHFLKSYSTQKLKDVPGLQDTRIRAILDSVSKDISNIEVLDPIVKDIINSAYASSIRNALQFSSFCCGFCLLLCLLKVALKIEGPMKNDVFFCK